MTVYIINHYDSLSGWHFGNKVYTCKAFAEMVYNKCEENAKNLVEAMHAKGFTTYKEYNELVELPVDTYRVD